MTDVHATDLVAQPTAIIGAGAVGQALARALHEHNVPITSIASRNIADAKALAHVVHATPTDTVASILPETTRVLLCVPDDSLSHVVNALTTVAPLHAPWIAAHTSGVHPAQVLAPLRSQGASVLSLHPLQTFTRNTPPTAFQGSRLTIEGDADAYDYGEALAQTLGAVPQHLASEAKPLYHLSAVLASNGLVALLAMAQHVWEAAGLERDDAFSALAPLVETTWSNIQQDGPAALTGPAARGDQETIATHLAALRHLQPEENTTHEEQDFDIESSYIALTEAMIRIQENEGRLSHSASERVRRIMRKGGSSTASDSPSK